MACVVKSIDLYNELLEQTSMRSIFVKTCRMYVKCEFILVAFKCLAYFTYKMSYLNMCNLSSRKDIEQLLPGFYHELTLLVPGKERGMRGGTMYHRGIFLSRTLERQMILN